MDGIKWDRFPNSGKANFHGYNNIGIGEAPIPVKAGIPIIGKTLGQCPNEGS